MIDHGVARLGRHLISSIQEGQGAPGQTAQISWSVYLQEHVQVHTARAAARVRARPEYRDLLGHPINTPSISSVASSPFPFMEQGVGHLGGERSNRRRLFRQSPTRSDENGTPATHLINRMGLVYARLDRNCPELGAERGGEGLERARAQER